MSKLFKKNEVTFAIAMIIIYVVTSMVGDSISNSIGLEKSITLPILVLLTAAITIFIKKNNLFEYYGLCKFKGEYKKFLYFIPLVIIVTRNFWCGATLHDGVLVSVLGVLSMLFVGFLEEVIFRGFLFNAMRKDNLKSAIIVSSLTFGIGHIVNLLNGKDLLSTLIQICYAVIFGFLCTMIYYYGKCLWSCIIVHSLNNAFSIFSVEANTEIRLSLTAVWVIVMIAYTVYIVKKHGGIKKIAEN